MVESVVKIRELLPKDWEKYKAIRLEALEADPIAFAETYENSVTHEDSFWQNRLESLSSIWLFAEVGSHIVGMIGAFIKDNKESPGTAILVGVYVNKDYRGKGIGKQLLAHLLQEIRTKGFIHKVKLWVAETQSSARKLYEGEGFAYIGKKAEPIEYNGRRYDELIMEKQLE